MSDGQVVDNVWNTSRKLSRKKNLPLLIIPVCLGSGGPVSVGPIECCCTRSLYVPTYISRAEQSGKDGDRRGGKCREAKKDEGWKYLKHSSSAVCVLAAWNLSRMGNPLSTLRALGQCENKRQTFWRTFRVLAEDPPPSLLSF